MNYYDLLIYRSAHQSLFVRDQSFTFTQLVAAIYKIKWRGKKKPTFSTSDTLPTGFVMSSDGIVSYDGSVIQSGVTNWTVTATDGVDTVTASMTMTLNEATVEIVDGQTFSFNIGVASQMQIQYVADGTPTFAVTSGTLPSGVTMTTGGLLEYDGTGSTGVSTSIEVTATLPTSTSDTATVGVKFFFMPQDYILCVKLKTDTVPEAGTFIDKNSNWTFGTAPDGTSAIGNNVLGFSYSMRFDVPTRVTGTNPITLSAWFYDLNLVSNCGLMGLGTMSFNHILSPEYSNSKEVGFPWGEHWVGSDFSSGNTLRPSANTWHNITITFDTEYVRWYTDGVLVGTSNDASNLSIGSSYLYLGSRVNDGRPFIGYIRNYLVYDRALGAREIQGIYDKGID